MKKTIFKFTINAVFGQNQQTISNEAISEKYRVEEITKYFSIKLLPFLNHTAINKNTINLEVRSSQK